LARRAGSREIVVVNPAKYPPTFTSFRESVVAAYAGGFADLDLGTLPAGAYSIYVIIAAEVAPGVAPSETRDLFCVLDTVPASPLGKTSQTTFPSLSSNGNAFAEMPMLATLSSPNALTVRARCELSPTTNSPYVRFSATMIATATSQLIHL
jgi:hypothetical protein